MTLSYFKTTMAKQKIAITVEEDLLKLVETKLEEGLFRNRSHFIEYSIKRTLSEIGVLCLLKSATTASCEVLNPNLKIKRMLEEKENE